MCIKISPSILGANFRNLEKDIRTLEVNGIKSIHIDVMDGNFVPNIAFGPDQIKMLRSISSDIEFDVHLMVANPDLFIDRLVEAGADSITVHAETCKHLYKTIYKIKSFGIKAGIALNPATPIEVIKHINNMINKVLVMTVEPGFGGQAFIPYMIDKLNELRQIKEKTNMEYDIQVDGGITLDNINEVVKAGANDIVVGSSLFAGGDLEEKIQLFNKAAVNNNIVFYINN